MTWYGWHGRPPDHNTERQNPHPDDLSAGSFTPLIRVLETATGELAKTQRRSLADALQQSGGEDGGSAAFLLVLVQMLDRLGSEILADRVSEGKPPLAGIVRPDGEADEMPRWTRCTRRREKSTCTTATIAACRWRLSAQGATVGAQNTMNGAAE